MWEYSGLREMVRNISLPMMIVDLDELEKNTRRMAALVKESGKTVRLATKSVRVPELIRMILNWGEGTIKGLMCFNSREAAYLSAQGFDDFLIAYPTMDQGDLEAVWNLNQRKKRILLMVDCPAHLNEIQKFWESRGDSIPLHICVDVDMSLRLMGLHLGVQRSPIRNLSGFQKFCEAVENYPHVHLAGVMGYEAQVAGLPDQSPFKSWMNPIKSLVKWLSVGMVARKRAEIGKWLEGRGIQLELFNAGGTGSLKTSIREKVVTEVTAGSGFLQSQLFDYYRSNQNQPAFCFALPITRQPQPGVITCQSGGFIASGEPSFDKCPRPFLPKNLKPFPSEGYGEVQTPFKVRGQLSLKEGDPVFLRPAKAGEIAEHFTEYHLKRGDEWVGKAKTYRGLGQRFF